jgi:hypothetical protein
VNSKQRVLEQLLCNLKDIQQTFEEGMNSLRRMGKLFTGAETRIYDYLSGRKSTAKSLRLERHTCQKHPHFIDQQHKLTEQQRWWRAFQNAPEEEKSPNLHCDGEQTSPEKKVLKVNTLASSDEVYERREFACLDADQLGGHCQLNTTTLNKNSQ